MNAEVRLPARLIKVRSLALLVGVVGIVLALVGAVFDTHAFFRSYLFGYLFWVGITVGALAVTMLHHLVGGAWGFLIQRMLEAATRTLPLMAVLFLPVLFGIHDLYHWSHAEAVETDPVLQHKAGYLNTPFFILRAVLYFLVWGLLAFLINRWSREQDSTRVGWISNRLMMISGPGLVLYVITTSFAAFDWGMSLDPHWFSTIYGLLFVVGQGLSTFAFMLVALFFVRRETILFEAASTDRIHDLGKLLLAFTMLWAYINLSQFIIMWSGNLPEEIVWYVQRLNGGWQWISLALAMFHFVLPFLVLLSRYTKRQMRTLASIAAWILFMRVVDLFWLITPSEERATLGLHLTDLAAPVGIGGIWVAVFLWQLGRRPLLPLHDPRLEEVFHAAH